MTRKRRKKRRTRKKIGMDVIHGRCGEVLAHAKPNYFKCVVTSPPYNTGQNYGPDYDDRLSFENYLNELDEMLYAVYRVMAPDGLFFLNMGNSHSDDMGFLKSHVIAGRACKLGFKQVEEIIWIKSITVEIDGELQSVGHFTPVRGDRLNPMFEYIFVLSKTDDYEFNRENLFVPYADKSNIGRYSDKDGRCIGDTWYIPYRTTGQKTKKPYPAQFPVELPYRCIKLAGEGPVLDPMCGGGAVGIAAMKLKQEVLLIDQSKKAVRVTKRRMEKFKQKLEKRRSR